MHPYTTFSNELADFGSRTAREELRGLTRTDPTAEPEDDLRGVELGLVAHKPGWVEGEGVRVEGGVVRHSPVG